jgi:hypothetical protein
MQFDAQNFMNAVFTEVNDTKIVPCPAGEFYAQIEKVEPKSGTIGKGERVGEPWASLAVTYTIEDEAVKQLVGRDIVRVTDGVMLDLTASGGLDMGKGKNIALGRLREATGLNQPGKQFSPLMLVGQRVKVAVRHVPGYRDPSSLVAEVSGVVKA